MQWLKKRFSVRFSRLSAAGFLARCFHPGCHKSNTLLRSRPGLGQEWRYCAMVPRLEWTMRFSHPNRRGDFEALSVDNHQQRHRCVSRLFVHEQVADFLQRRSSLRKNPGDWMNGDLGPALDERAQTEMVDYYRYSGDPVAICTCHVIWGDYLLDHAPSLPLIIHGRNFPISVPKRGKAVWRCGPPRE